MPTLTRPSGQSPRPAKKAAAKAPAPRRRPAEDDDIERPTRRRSSSNDDGIAGGEGWGGADEVGTDPNFTKRLDLEKGQTAVFKFLEDQPYYNLRVHWVQRTGKRSFICLGTDDCPLCALGDLSEVNSEHRFNVAVFTEEAPVLRSLNVSRAHANEFKEWNLGPRGPLTKLVYTRTRPSKPGGRYKHTQLRYPDDEVPSDYPKLHLPTQAELDELIADGLYTRADVLRERTPLEEMEKIAAELTGEGDYDDD